MKSLIVDDHVLIREALRAVLEELKGDDAVIWEAATAGQALEIVRHEPEIELILLDLGLPDRDGFDTLTELLELYPSVAIVVLSAFDDRERIAKCLDLGALGFIPKSAGREVMLSALNLIFSGGVYIPPEILVGQYRETGQMSSTEPLPSNGAAGGELALTGRQMQVLALMMRGMSNKAICRELELAEPTVKVHVSAILKALRVTNRTEAVIAAARLGLGPRSEEG